MPRGPVADPPPPAARPAPVEGPLPPGPVRRTSPPTARRVQMAAVSPAAGSPHPPVEHMARSC